MYENITIGADPEMFLRRHDGVYIPCIDIVGGTKREPRVFTDEGHALQEDNVMVEFNVPPSRTKDEFIENIKTCMDYILDNIEDDLGIEAVPSVEFDWDDLDHPQARMSGCSPYFNVYTKRRENVDLERTNVRYAGGHIHVGFDDPNMEMAEKLVKSLDLHLGLPSLILDDDERRRQTYGKAGMFRDKPYGLEYRSLSNFWLQSEELMELVFDNTMRAVEFLNEGNELPDNLNTIINNGKKQQALEILHSLEIQYQERRPPVASSTG